MQPTCTRNLGCERGGPRTKLAEANVCVHQERDDGREKKTFFAWNSFRGEHDWLWPDCRLQQIRRPRACRTQVCPSVCPFITTLLLADIVVVVVVVGIATTTTDAPRGMFESMKMITRNASITKLLLIMCVCVCMLYQWKSIYYRPKIKRQW